MSEARPNPPAASEPPEQGGGVLTRISERINWPATVAVSAAATLAGSVLFHKADFRDDSVPAAVQRFLTPDLGTDYQTTTSRQYTRRHVVEHSNRTGSVDTTDTFYLNRSDQAYARNFNQDPHAGEYTNPKELDGIVNYLAGTVHLGQEIRSIKITGYASAEDDSPGGGLRTPSEKNRLLAQKRASVVKEELQQAISQHPGLAEATQDTTFIFGEPVEQQLTEDQAKMVGELAHEAGFDNAEQVIHAWNIGQDDLPEIYQEALSDWLGDARKVEVDVASGQPGEEVIVNKKYCVRYNIIAIQTHEHHQENNLPLPLPILIPIPILRRKPGTNEEEVSEPDPEPPTDDNEQNVSEEAVEVEDDSDLVAEETVPAGGPLPSSYQPGRVVRSGGYNRGTRVANTVVGFGGALLAAGVLFVNVSGRNCHGDGHTPRPWLVDLVWQTIDYDTGRGADVSQKISIGIPFVSEAQLDLEEEKPGNIWGLDGEEACEKSDNPDGSGSITGGSGSEPRPPKCSQVDIVRRNGKTVTKRTVYQAPPLSTQRVIKQHR